MLKHLLVRNYALIRELDMDLEVGLSVITGETGAGKSIILGALRLILGERADSKVLFESETKCIVEGEFDITHYKLKHFFEENDLDYAHTTIIRREIQENGKSRAFVNDTPVNLVILKELGEKLVDIHSQHETLELKSRSFQYDIIDSYADSFRERSAYHSKYSELRITEEELERLKNTDAKSRSDLDLYQFQLDELIEANLKSDQMADLEEEFAVLSRSEDIQKAMALAENNLQNELGILDKLREIKSAFDPLESVSERLSDISSRLRSVLIELDDLGSEITGSGTDFDEQRYTELSNRLDLINTLMRKHKVNSIEELIQIREELDSRLSDVSNLEDRILQTEARAIQLRKEAEDLAKVLDKKRRIVLDKLTGEIETLLGTLSMPDSKIRFDLQPGELNNYGNTNLEVLFRTNLGTPFELLHKAASGGEMARLMLSLKSIVAVRKKLPTIIFDEIDTGVSGEVASRMGGIMRQMGSYMQVIAITHLPQVAGKGEHHYNVYKESSGNKTNSFIKQLDNEERLTEIAKMLSGDKVEQAALETARGLIQMN